MYVSWFLKTLKYTGVFDVGRVRWNIFAFLSIVMYPDLCYGIVYSFSCAYFTTTTDSNDDIFLRKLGKEILLLNPAQNDTAGNLQF